MSGNARILLGMLGLQTVLLLVLVAKALVPTPEAAPLPGPLASSGKLANTANPDLDLALLSIFEQLARIEARLDALEALRADATPAPAASVPERALSRAEISTYVGQVTAQVDRLSLQPQVSSTDIDAVMATIARMPPSARNAALAELNRALNSGRINGQY